MAPARTSPASASSSGSPSPSDAGGARARASGHRPGGARPLPAALFASLALHGAALAALVGLAGLLRDPGGPTRRAVVAALPPSPAPVPEAEREEESLEPRLEPEVTRPEPRFEDPRPEPPEVDEPPAPEPVDPRPLPDRFAPPSGAPLGGPPRTAPAPPVESEPASEPLEPEPPPAPREDDGPTEPELIDAPPPHYPALARRRGWEGSVLLLLSVDAAGRVHEVEVLESSGRSVLDDAAVAGVRRWRFAPGADGRSARHRVTFRIEG